MSQQLNANNAMKRGWLATQNRIAQQVRTNGFFMILDRDQTQTQTQMQEVTRKRSFTVKYDEMSDIIFNHERELFHGPVIKPRDIVEESLEPLVPVDDLEISNAVKALARYESPGPSGWPCGLYRKSDCARHALKLVANDMLCDPASICADFAQGYIKLVHKHGDHSLLSNFQRTFVFNAEYRIVACVFAERLRLILESQLSPEVLTLGKGLYERDEIYTLQVAAKLLEQTDRVGTFIKLDFANIADTILRAPVFAHLAKLGVPLPMVNFVEALVGSMSAAVEVNGGLTAFFPVRCGFPTGDPLSRVLLAVALDMFSCELRKNDLDNIGAMTDGVALSC